MAASVSIRSGLAMLAASASACGRVGFDANGGDGGSSATQSCANRTFSTPALSSLVDDFAGTTIASPWLVPNNGMCITQASGSLLADLVANNEEYCVAYAQGGWHLTCDSVTFEVAHTPAQVVGVQTVLYLDAPSTQTVVSVILEANSLQWSLASNQYFPYDATADRWWRLRENDGELYFETSPDGATFATLSSGSDPASLDDIHPDIGAGTYKNIVNPGSAAFRCFNASSCQ
jgi:hypothetical protein